MKITGAKAYEIDALARRTADGSRTKPASGQNVISDDPSRVSISNESRARGALHAERTERIDALRDRFRDGGLDLKPAAIARAMLDVDEA